MSKRLFLVLLPLLIGLSMAATARAEGKDHEEKRAKVEARLKQLHRDLLRKDVGLDDKKAAEAERVLDRYAPERRKLKQEQREHRAALRALLESDSNDDAAYARAVKGVREGQKKLLALNERESLELAKLMTAKQQAKYLHAVQKLRRELRRKVREHRRGKR
jgi:hypothetical protein